jgi:peroxiredoxin family protein
MTETKKTPLKKVIIIVAKANLEDVYAGLIMANGAVLEGIETKLFFTFFGIDAITKKRMMKLHTASVGNPGMRLPRGLHFPTLLGALPGVEAGVSVKMKKQMGTIDIPPIDEFLDLITAGGGEIYACKTAADMYKLGLNDFCEHVKAIITVRDLYAMAGGEGTQMLFT